MLCSSFGKKSTEKERTAAIILGTRRKRNILRRSFVAEDENEISFAEVLWLKDAQKIFRAEPNFKQRERSLRLFDDYDGILRSQGRLDYPQLPYCARHPAVLPRGHHITRLIVRKCHSRVMHITG